MLRDLSPIMTVLGLTWVFVAACIGQDEPSFYDPIERPLQGWTIAVDPRLLNGEHADLGRRAMEALENHLLRVKYIVPKDRLAQLLPLRIWLELDNPTLSNMQYHPDRGWLLANGQDPRLVKHVHIPRRGIT